MPWSRPLSEPIILKDGCVIVTLNDARVVMRSLPATRQSSDVWLYASGLMLEAATSDGPIGPDPNVGLRAVRPQGRLLSLGYRPSTKTRG
jgi:hypothetical protein